MVCVPSLGRSGGLLAAWKSNLVKVDILSQSRQLIHVRCGFPYGCVFFVTAIYALPDYRQKQILWDTLRQYASSMVDPWAVIGDFNNIVSSAERTGGMRVHDARCSLFSDRIRDCNLVDLVAVGPKFTWKGPKVQGGRCLFERLDRVIANAEFISVFSECSVQWGY
ncbi:hypothetical protein K1719_024378 [Acacia pycnantha]|nr:hypothetical protein K1719_024378 [Acacia pycnantha]